MQRQIEVKMCARCKRTLRSSVIQRCHDEAVNKYLGEYICIYCCKKCKHHTKHPLCDAIGCKYIRSRFSDG